MPRRHSPTAWRLAFAARLASLRAARGLSYRALAAASGVSFPHLFSLEHGGCEPGALALAGLSRALGVSVHWLVTGEEWVAWT